MPNVTVSDDLAYVTEPASQELHIVDLTNAEDGAEGVVSPVDLPQVPNETAVTSRAAPSDTGDENSDHGGHHH